MKIYKTSKKNRVKALKYYYQHQKERLEYDKRYYYKHRKKILKRQTRVWTKKYKTDIQFHKKRKFRDDSRRMIDGYKKIEGCCNRCGSKKDLQRHHPNYKKPNFIVLCRNCHNSKHGRKFL